MNKLPVILAAVWCAVVITLIATRNWPHMTALDCQRVAPLACR